MNIDDYVRIMFLNVTLNTETLDMHVNYLQPVWCNDLYEDDSSWKQLGDISSRLVCPNTT